MKKARVIPHTSWAAKSLWSVEGKTMSMLLFALAILGIGDGLIVLANLGSSPWTVLSQGVALQAKVSIGWSSFLDQLFGDVSLDSPQIKAWAWHHSEYYCDCLFPWLNHENCARTNRTFLAEFLFGGIGLLLYGLGTALYLTCHQGQARGMV